MRDTMKSGAFRLFRTLWLTFIVSVLTFGANTARAGTLEAAVLKFGTVNWLLDVIKHHKLDAREDFDLQIVELASNQATQIALLSGEVDTAVSDWFWVLQQKALGTDLLFIPYSAALGAVMVRADSPVKTIAGLKGKRIGVAGGALDKSWLLVRAHVKRAGGGDLAETATPVFAAPPLLNEQLATGQVDAVINYWHFAAKLEAAGFRRVASIADLMKDFNIPAPLPLVGFIISAKLAEEKPALVRGFTNAMQNAQRIMLTSDAEWNRLRPMMNVKSDAEFKVMIERYRDGLLHTWSGRERTSAGKLFDLMVQTGGEQVTGKNVKFNADIFWNGLVF